MYTTLILKSLFLDNFLKRLRKLHVRQHLTLNNLNNKYAAISDGVCLNIPILHNNELS